MHIYEGILAGTLHGKEVLAAGMALSALGTAIGLRGMDSRQVPKVAVLSSAFFAASLVHVPLGLTSAHLMLCGLMGLVLGWAAFPAILVALLLQAVFFSFGGLTTLGLNTAIMALPAVACHYVFRSPVRAGHETLVFAAGFAAGATSIVLGGLLSTGALWAAGQQFERLAQAVLLAHVPMACVEGLVTGSVVVLLRKVRPEVLDAPALLVGQSEVFDGP